VNISPYYQIEGDRHRSKLFVVMSGAICKGTALGRIRQLMAIADEAWERDNLQSGLSTGEGSTSASAERAVVTQASRRMHRNMRSSRACTS
jgi:hypothetical protein